MNNYNKDFEAFLQYIANNLIKPEEKLKIKNYEDFLVLLNNIIKILKKQINKESAIDIKETKINQNLINQSLINIFKTLEISNNINQEKVDTNQTLSPIVDKIYINYLYICNNYKLHNQREASNASSFFDSLLDLFSKLYQHTNIQFKNYYELFTENINNLLSLIDLKVCGNLFEGQINFDKLEKNYIDLNKKASNIYEEAFKEIKGPKKCVSNNIKIKLENYYNLYCKGSDINKMEPEKLENEINEEITKYVRNMNNLIGKFNDINQKLNISTSNIILNKNAIQLNKNNNKYEKNTERDNIVLDALNTIGNIFISIGNWFSEKDELKKNLNEFENKIYNKLDRLEASFNENIYSIKNTIFRTTNNNMLNLTSDFDKIKDKRKQYEQIKEKFYNIIYPENDA